LIVMIVLMIVLKIGVVVLSVSYCIVEWMELFCLRMNVIVFMLLVKLCEMIVMKIRNFVEVLIWKVRLILSLLMKLCVDNFSVLSVLMWLWVSVCLVLLW